LGANDRGNGCAIRGQESDRFTLGERNLLQGIQPAKISEGAAAVGVKIASESDASAADSRARQLMN
jgi:hypothetical protein